MNLRDIIVRAGLAKDTRSAEKILILIAALFFIAAFFLYSHGEEPVIITPADIQEMKNSAQS